MGEPRDGRKRHKARPAAVTAGAFALTHTRDAHQLSAEELLQELRTHQIELEMQNEALREAQVAMEESRDQYVDLFEFAPIGYLIVNRGGLISSVNRAGATMMGLTPRTLLKRRFLRLVCKPDRDRWNQFFTSMLNHHQKENIELAMERSDHAKFHARLDCARVDHNGETPVLRVALSDITALVQATQALRESKDRLDLALKSSRLTLWDFDIASDRVYLSDQWQVMLGNQPRDTEVSMQDLLALTHPDDLAGVAAALTETLAGGAADYVVEHRVRTTNGSWKWIYSHGMVTRRDASGKVARMTGIHADIDQRKAAEARIEHLAYHDVLTGLPNRALLLDHLRLALSQAKRSGFQLAVVFIDLDRFKTINDTLGHPVGDELLRQVADRLRAVLRDGDTVARLGGDEFLILLPHVPVENNAVHAVTKVLAVLASVFTVAGYKLHISASAGISVYPRDGEDCDTLVEHADIALYQAKSTGGGSYCFFSATMNERAHMRLSIENNLREALDRNELTLHYQAQIDTRSQRIAGVEALMRWRHHELGMVSPTEFIPIAEETGLIKSIGEWALFEACSQARAWDNIGIAPLRIAVNISARQLQQVDLPQRIERILELTGLAADRLELELTESSVMAEPERSIGVLTELRAMGVQLALDDFGTGYSSLAYLTRLPLNRVKIDRAFVRDISKDATGTTLAQIIIAMAHQLKLIVVAEGVETLAQQDLLMRWKCDEMQGFLFSEPLAGQSIPDLIGRGSLFATATPPAL